MDNKRRSVETNVADYIYFYNLGRKYIKSGDLEKAEDCFRQVLKLNNGYSEAYYHLGRIFFKRGKYEEAIKNYRRVIEIDPDHAKAYFSIGLIFQLHGKIREAEKFYLKAIEMNPDFAEAYSNLSSIFCNKRDLGNALYYAVKSVRLQPQNPFSLNNLGKVYGYLYQYDKAVKFFKKAIEIKPDLVEAYSNLGSCYLNLRDIRKSLYFTEKALSLNPNFVEARCNRGFIYLTLGEYEKGWQDYEWRWYRKEFEKIKRDFSKPIWNGEDIVNKTLFVFAEQGFGDTIQFCRFLKIARKKVGKLIFEVPSALKKIIDFCEGADLVIKSGERIPDFDFYVPLLSLPRVLNIKLQDVYTGIPYLSVKRDDLARNSILSKYKDKFKIGFVWAGNREHLNDLNRSIDVTYFIRLTDVPNVQLFSLQKNPSEADCLKLRENGKIVDLNEYINDFYDTAIFIKNMDLVVSADTAVAHLAGAIGKNVWLLLPYNSDWRWLLDGEDSPWYPTMRIFRQKKLGNWENVFDNVFTELKKLIK